VTTEARRAPGEMRWLDSVCDSLAKGFLLYESAKRARITVSTITEARRKYPHVDAAMSAAEEASVDILELAARRRAVDGDQEFVLHQGQRVPLLVLDEHGRPEMIQLQDPTTGALAWYPRQQKDESGNLMWLTNAKRSDMLLALLLKGRRKSVFSDRTEITGADGGAVAVDETTSAARIASILDAAKRRAAGV
jgi:hypothetical protein